MGASGSCCIGEEEGRLLVTKMDLSHCGCIEVPNIVFNSERCIENLNLSSNQIISLPPQLFHCQELKHLNLSDNCLETIPEAVGSLCNLLSLKLDKNNVTTLPENLKKCRKLKRLSLNNNTNIKNLLNVVTKVISLQDLYLNNCDLKFLTASIGRLNRLKILELRNNSICNLPLSFTRLEQLSRLDIGDNDFLEFPKCIASMTSITELYMDNNGIEEIINIEELKNLQHFDISYNNITQIHEGLGHCTQLNMLNLSHNYIETIPNTIHNLSNLQYLNLESNEISSLTNNIGKLCSLEDLNLCNNQLNILPSSVGLLRKLQHLNISNNLIEELPNDIGSCNSLTILNLSYNRLQLLPGEVGYLNKLVVLNVIGNFLMYLPISINNLTSVKAIWLSSNQNVPLIPFVQDSNGLTNITLPQVGETYNTENLYSKNGSWQNVERKIRFAEDEDVLPGKLHRTPTPFPKELRAPYKKSSPRNEKSEASANNDNYVNILNGQVCEDELLRPPAEPITINNSVLPDSSGFTSGIREANIRKSTEREKPAEEIYETRKQKVLLEGTNKDELNLREQLKVDPKGPRNEGIVKADDVAIDIEIIDEVPDIVSSNQDVTSKDVRDSQEKQREEYENCLINELKQESLSFHKKLEYFEFKKKHDEKPEVGSVKPDEQYPSNKNNFVIYHNMVNVDNKEYLNPDRRNYDPNTVRQMYHNDIVLDYNAAVSGPRSSPPRYDSMKNIHLYQNTNEMPQLENRTHYQPVFNTPSSRMSESQPTYTPPPSRMSDLHGVYSNRMQELQHNYNTPPPMPRSNLTQRSYEVESRPTSDQLRNRTASPPCYEIAKMYSTKAALFQKQNSSN